MKTKKPFSIGEVAKMIGVEIHTIRFWTEEFGDYINFTLGKGDRRYYDENAIKILQKIQTLIHTDGIRIKAIKEKKMLLPEVSQPDNSSESLLKALALLKEAKLLLK